MTNHNDTPVVTDVLPGTPEWEESERELNKQRAAEFAAEVADCVRFIRDNFDGIRDSFLEDAGGYLAQTDADYSDEVAAAAIAEIRAEWGDPMVVNGAQVLAAIAEATSLPAYIEQTGGGTATIYVGEKDSDDRYAVVIGPGRFGGYADPSRSDFLLGDLWIGPDDNGDDMTKVIGANTLEEVTTATREVLDRPIE